MMKMPQCSSCDISVMEKIALPGPEYLGMDHYKSYGGGTCKQSIQKNHAREIVRKDFMHSEFPRKKDSCTVLPNSFPRKKFLH